MSTGRTGDGRAGGSDQVGLDAWYWWQESAGYLQALGLVSEFDTQTDGSLTLLTGAAHALVATELSLAGQAIAALCAAEGAVAAAGSESTGAVALARGAETFRDDAGSLSAVERRRRYRALISDLRRTSRRLRGRAARSASASQRGRIRGLFLWLMRGGWVVPIGALILIVVVVGYGYVVSRHRLGPIGVAPVGGLIPVPAPTSVERLPPTVGSVSPEIAGEPSNCFGAIYYRDVAFNEPFAVRRDCEIEFDWKQGTPEGLESQERFSARWEGTIEPPVTGTYTFFVGSDDGSRLFIDDRKVIDNWGNHGVIENSGRQPLVAGRAYRVRLDYYEDGGDAVIYLLWAGGGMTRRPLSGEFVHPLPGWDAVAASR